MVTIKDGCGCDPCDCNWKQKLKEAYARASVSVNKVGDFDGAIYYPDGSGYVKLPIPRLSEIQLIHTNKDNIDQLKVEDIRLQSNIDAEKTARIAKDENLDSDISRIDATDARQSELIQDNADRINSTYNDLVATEATVATHDSEIITLQANNQALAKSLVSDVIMTDGTTAGSVQVSIEKEDGTLITSANYRWGKDIGIRLEAGTQAGYVKAVISLSDGTELVSNEYKIVEVLESDIYVTAITFIADQAAGTLGGNISYSNGTTQTINSVSVPTAPGVTSAIETLQGRMTAVEQKNANQDASITAIDGRVQALENAPGIGQFANGRLGTIAGSTTDGRIKAETDGSGSVNGWSDLKGRINTAEGQIVVAQDDISSLDGRVGTHDTEISGIMSDITAIETKNTQQDTAINGKVSIAQGAANAGKVLGIGSDGNVTPTEVSADGEVWEELDLSNFPTDWVNGDRYRIQFKVGATPSASSWKSAIQSVSLYTYNIPKSPVLSYEVLSEDQNPQSIINFYVHNTAVYGLLFTRINPVANYTAGIIGTITPFAFNGVSSKTGTATTINKSNIQTYVYKMWRLKK